MNLSFNDIYGWNAGKSPGVKNDRRASFFVAVLVFLH